MLKTTTHGDGASTVLVLHDWLGDHRSYAPTLPYLDRNSYTWVFADLRGYGMSRALEGTYTLAEAAEDVGALTRSFGQVHLVAHSMSSLVAQKAAVTHPSLYRGLVLVAPISPDGMGTPEPMVQWLRDMALDVAVRATSLGPRMTNRHGPGWASFMLERWAEAAEPETVCAYVDLFSHGSVDGVFPILPVRVILGAEDDEPFHEATVRAGLSKAWSDLEVTVLPAAGHYPMLETPAAFAEALRHALASML